VTSTVRSQMLGLFRSSCYSFAALLLLSLAGYSQSLPAPPLPPPVIAVRTELVVLPVRVTDANGDFVSGLSADDFRVYQDRHLQELSLFQREDTPVAVGLLVDHSRSMGPKLAEVVSAIVAFSKSSNPQDEMFVVDFNDDVSLELPGGTPFTHDPMELVKAVSAVSARGRTALYDAVNVGLNHLLLATTDKRALIIVSDGGDNASQHKYGEILAAARRSQTVIYSIGLIGDPNQEDEDPKLLQRLCNETGGIAFFPMARESVTDVSARIARDLREQYTLGFSPDNNNGGQSFRKIEVKVTAPGRGKIHVQTRRGYFNAERPADPGKPAS